MFRINHQRQAEEQASRAWDAVARGETPADSDLDPALIETIRRLKELGDQPRPDSTFADRLEDELIRAMDIAPFAPLPTTRMLTTVPNGQLVRHALPQAPPRLDGSRSRWALAQFATAALVVLVLAGSLFAVESRRFRQEEEAPVVISAIVGTPEASPAPAGITEDTVLFQQRIDEIPAGADWAGVERTTLAPGAVMNQGTPSDAGVGPYLYRVEAGTVTGHANGPIAVTRAGKTTEELVSPDTDVVLTTGDVAFVRPNVASHWRNAGSSPATVLDTGISTPGSMNGGAWVDGTLLSFAALIDAWPVTPPPAPEELSVHQMTLAPGASLPNGPEPGLKLVGVESGTLTLIWAKRTDPTVQTGTHQLRSGAFMDINGTDFIAKELRNDGSEPLTLLLMTVVSLSEPAATPTTIPTASAVVDTGLLPVASPAARNPAPPGGRILLQSTFDTLPDQAAWAGVERTTLQPGATWDLNKTGKPSNGPRLFLIEAGALAVTADGPLQVEHAGSATPVAASPGVELTLHEGDRGVAPSGTAVHWRNTGNGPTQVLDAWIDTLGIPTPPDRVSQEELVSRWPIDSLTSPVLLTVQEIDVAPGDHLIPASIPGLQGFAVESGTLHVHDSGDGGTPPGDFTVPVGASRVFGGPGYSEVPRSWTVSSADANPVTLIILTMPPASPLEEGTPMG